MKNLKLIVISAIVILSFAHQVHAKATYTFGIVPQQAAGKLARLWSPFLDYLSRETGLSFQFATAKDIPTFENRLAKSEYDFSYMNPYHFVYFNERAGYQALVKAQDKKIRGIVVVHKDSPYKKLSDLKNQHLAFPSPNAFAASILPRGELENQQIPFNPEYVSSHDSVYMNVAHKTFAAGGGVMRTFKSFNPELRKHLRVLYKTNGYTPHAFAHHSRIPKEHITRISQALQKMHTTTEGKQLLASLKLKGLIPAKNSDWDDVRKLKLQ
ncbi:MAG: phosphate/phosphite/phosphonate ABC transporter substrate-binding protein [Gammaproteobacteria bacterium]|nr:phosphate/phosphite/phosphonate ABC transporter substrate-binding protein [Gammaproteobacteria bacterium]MDH5800359.1 phosphate/phosphite/phosphonate ABC transporter substrate-binding protein [Gammaproteobacteria bacterium]